MVVVNDTNASEANERAILQHLAGQRVAGMILSPHSAGRDFTAMISALPMPFVLFDHRLEGSIRTMWGPTTCWPRRC